MKKHLTYHNYDKRPVRHIPGHTAWCGWDAVRGELARHIGGSRKIVTAEFYPGVHRDELVSELSKLGGVMIDAEDCTLPNGDYQALIARFITEDRVFGVMNTLRLEDIYLSNKISYYREMIAREVGLVVVHGVGASLITEGDILLYFDMPRWEIQCRFKEGMPNWKTDNAGGDKLCQFKRGFFVEWRMADLRKRKLLDKIDFAFDTVTPGSPRMAHGDAFRAGLREFASKPFRLVPYFAPEVWGGQWMKKVCGLDASAENYAWAFDGVPEENSILMQFNDICMEFPAVDVVFYQPARLLGQRVHARFGDEFPIRFDLLDTMGGQNLSLQTHPLTEYIQHTFGMHYTQDESYYIMDAGEDAVVFLGLKEGVVPAEMLADLHAAQQGNASFAVDRYVNELPARPHDHFLIPGGTVHCSGKNTMVLEISATPYIFTFKLWDWGRLGLDGKPRPVHISHGEQVIQWDRTTGWVQKNLVNRFEVLEESPGFTETRTGLHEREFIETHTYDLRRPAGFENNGSVSMCNVVSGPGAVISSPDGGFEPYELHYAETFIIPASVTAFTLAPLGESCRIIRAWVR